MESAVLERPEVEAVVEALPEFDNAAWAAKMGVPEGESLDRNGKSGIQQAASIAEALGQPESLEDLWPGHVYIPPKIKQLRTLLPLAQSIFDKLGTDSVMEAFDDAVTFVKLLARREEANGELNEVSTDEIEDRFDEEEIARIITHIMSKQGLLTDNPSGNAPSGRLTGLKNFQQSVAITQDTDSNTAEI